MLELFSKAIPFLSTDFAERNKALFEKEHLGKLSQKLIDFGVNGVPASHPLPHFYAECTPSLQDAYADVGSFMKKWLKDKKDTSLPKQLAEALEKTGIKNLLILLGQRLTPASLSDEQAIPPLREILLASTTTIFSDKLTIVARAWTKHTNRSSDLFWGEIKGSDEYKNQTALDFIQQILDNCTWWNVFGHYKHETVFEARLPSGHGARWGDYGKVFIGFLEPFLDEEEEN